MVRKVSSRTTITLVGAALLALVAGACSGNGSNTAGDGSGGFDGGNFGQGGSGGILYGNTGGSSGFFDTGGSSGFGTGGVVLGGGGTAGSGATDGGEPPDASVPSGRDSGSADAAPGDAEADAGKNCGNGVVDPGEDCEPGDAATGCKPNCHWMCSPGAAGDALCDDHLPCDGTETCGTDHVCAPGTRALDGSACGTGMVCKTGLCVSATCGDGFRADSEECDDGNAVDGDGCDANCRFSCVSTDTSRDCSALLTGCVATAVCNDGTHVCSTPATKPDGALCGAHNYCKTGVCTLATCGNLIVEPTENCEDGNKTDGDGCDNDCTYSCGNAATDCDLPPSCKKQQCTLSNTCQAVADTSQDGTSCGAGKACSAGSCIPLCGNGVVDPGEDCDDENKNDNDGCRSDCKFTCSDPVADCINPTSICDKWTCNPNSHLCQAVPDAAKNDTACGSGFACNANGLCVAACGNGFLDPGEQCDDKNFADGDGCQQDCTYTCSNPVTDCTGAPAACNKWTCGATTHVCTAAADTTQNSQACGSGQICFNGSCGNACGNGNLDAGEDCDDANKTNGDGCDNNCKYSCANPVSDCTPVPCEAATCSALHICRYSPDPVQNDLACGSGLVCFAGVCAPSCGNAIVDGADGEDCDDGNDVNGDGCDNNCKYSCANPANDCPKPSLCNKASCTAAHTCQNVSDAGQDDTACGSGKVCSSGTCVSACGNHLLDAGEQCDDGNQTNGDGCDSDCTYSCINPATDCGAAPSCQKEACTNAHTCQPAPDATLDGQTCGSAKVCSGGACVDSCGNGVVDPGEQCDPPNGTTCDATCQNECDPNGSWASLLTVPVTWTGDGFYLVNGSGTLKVWSLITTTNAGTTNTVLPCGVSVPNYGSAFGTYTTTYPTSLFDSGYLTASSMSATFSSLKAGATYSSASPFTALIGLSAPATGTWPAAPSGVTSADQDKDTKPGVTANTNAPTAFLGAVADHVDVAFRQTATLSGTLKDCSTLSGSATVSHQDSHVLGCTVPQLFGGDLACNATQSTFLDDHRPVYVPGAATFNAVKLTSAATCAAVRAKFPPYP